MYQVARALSASREMACHCASASAICAEWVAVNWGISAARLRMNWLCASRRQLASAVALAMAAASAGVEVIPRASTGDFTSTACRQRSASRGPVGGSGRPQVRARPDLIHIRSLAICPVHPAVVDSG